MPFPWIWCIFFFLMMITIGFGSILSLSECVLDSITEAFKDKLNTKRKQTILRFVVCMLFFLVGLFMSTRVWPHNSNKIFITYLLKFKPFSFQFKEQFVYSKFDRHLCVGLPVRDRCFLGSTWIWYFLYFLTEISRFQLCSKFKRLDLWY